MMYRFRSELKVLGSAIVCLGAQQFAVSAQERFPNNLLGCYSLTLGKWSPPIYPSDVRYHTPPQTFRLTNEPQILDPRAPQYRKVEPPIVHPGSHGRERAFWFVSDSTLRVIWSDGLTGASLELNLVARLDSLAGRIRVLTDVVGGDRPPEALAFARRSMCQ